MNLEAYNNEINLKYLASTYPSMRRGKHVPLNQSFDLSVVKLVIQTNKEQLWSEIKNVDSCDLITCKSKYSLSLSLSRVLRVAVNESRRVSLSAPSLHASLVDSV